MLNSLLSRSKSPDLVVIGGGSGGLAAAKRAASHGASVTLIERDALGGTCVNRGCVPKKLLFEAAQQQWEQNHRMGAGLSALNSLDFKALRTRIDDKIGDIRASFVDDLETVGVTLLRGTARVNNDLSVTVDETTLTPQRVLLATGARAKALDIPGSELLHYSYDVLRWQSVPRRLAIFGGGYIGCEFAAIFRALGASVTLIQSGERLLPGFAPALSDIALDNLQKQGVRVILKDKPAGLRHTNRGVSVVLEKGDTLDTDVAVAAIGRAPHLGSVLDNALLDRVAVADTGAVEVQGAFETSVLNLHAIGDVADRLPLTPVATRDGEAFADMVFDGAGEAIDLGLVTTASFVLPPVAQVGNISEASDLGTSGDLKHGVLTNGRAPDLIRHLEWDGEHLAGAALAGDSAAELIVPLAALLGMSATRDDIARATGVHPSFAEELIGR